MWILFRLFVQVGNMLYNFEGYKKGDTKYLLCKMKILEWAGWRITDLTLPILCNICLLLTSHTGFPAGWEAPSQILLVTMLVEKVSQSNHQMVWPRGDPLHFPSQLIGQNWSWGSICSPPDPLHQEVVFHVSGRHRTRCWRSHWCLPLVSLSSLLNTFRSGITEWNVLIPKENAF